MQDSKLAVREYMVLPGGQVATHTFSLDSLPPPHAASSSTLSWTSGLGLIHRLMLPASCPRPPPKPHLLSLHTCLRKRPHFSELHPFLSFPDRSLFTATVFILTWQRNMGGVAMRPATAGRHQPHIGSLTQARCKNTPLVEAWESGYVARHGAKRVSWEALSCVLRTHTFPPQHVPSNQDKPEAVEDRE